MTVLEAIRAVLVEAEGPLHYREITRRILDRGLWTAHGKTPEATVNAQITHNMAGQGEKSDFVRTDNGIYSMRTVGVERPQTGSLQHSTLSFTHAAERVLRDDADGQPMHYRDITAKALERGLVKTSGQTPHATLYAQILSEIDRKKKRGLAQRFVKRGNGLIALSPAEPMDLARRIQEHNAEIRKQLLARLTDMPPLEFEELISRLLAEIGFEEIEVTSFSGDGGIDVRGVLVVGEVIRTHMAVQAKRWKNNVQAPIVQQVRGSLGTHDQGLIITTSDFSTGARQEAQRPNAVPVALMNGEQLVGLLVEHEVEIVRTPHYLLEIVSEIVVEST